MVSKVIGVELPSRVDDTGTDASDEEAGGATTGEVEAVVIDTGGEVTGGDDGIDGTPGEDEAGGDETGGETTGREATGEDVKVGTDVEDKEEEPAGIEAEIELPGGVREVVPGAVPVAGTVSKPVLTETFLVGIV